MVNLTDIVEQWASIKGWWFYKSLEKDGAYKYVNLSIRNRPPFGLGSEYATLYEDGHLDMGNSTVRLVPADPKFFDTLEALLSTI